MYYERHLPHWHPEGAAVFVTWRLYGSLPRERAFLISNGREAGHSFSLIDRELAEASIGPKWLADSCVAKEIASALEYGERELKLFSLRSWVIMPNHVHILIYPERDLSRITRAIKNYTGRRANEILERTGQAFWQNESYDHWVRDADGVERIVRYIEGNPVAAGFVARPEDWRWSSGWAGQEAYPTKGVEE